MSAQTTPEGYHTATPYMIFNDAAKAIEFYKKAFGATEIMRISGPGGKVGHAEIKIGDSPIMMADEHPEMGARSAEAFGGSPVSIMLYFDDVDEAFPRALRAGGTEVQPVEDKFYGDRAGTLKDPFGYQWTLATHVEDVPPEEMDRRIKEFMAEGAGA